MKYYTDENTGEVFAYDIDQISAKVRQKGESEELDEDAIQLEINSAIADIVGDKTEMTDEAVNAYINPQKTIAELIADALREINNEFNKRMLEVKAGVPTDEIYSWDKQEAEARAYLADVEAATPLVNSLATARGIDKAELVSKIIGKADLFAGISGGLIGTRQGLEDQLDTLAEDEDATPEDVAAVVWPS